MIMVMIMIVFRVEAENPVAIPVQLHTVTHKQNYLHFTLNTLIMKHKFEVIKIIVTISLVRLFQSLITLVPKKLT